MDKITPAAYISNWELKIQNFYFMQLKPGEHPNYPEGKEDNTHFNELGARLVAQLVLDRD